MLHALQMITATTSTVTVPGVSVSLGSSTLDGTVTALLNGLAKVVKALLH